VVERCLVRIIDLRDIDPDALHDGTHAMGSEVLPYVGWLKMGVKMAQERPGLTRSDFDLTRQAGSSGATRLLVPRPVMPERRPMVFPSLV
jgi:hypothetical protein